MMSFVCSRLVCPGVPVTVAQQSTGAESTGSTRTDDKDYRWQRQLIAIHIEGATA